MKNPQEIYLLQVKDEDNDWTYVDGHEYLFDGGFPYRDQIVKELHQCFGWYGIAGLQDSQLAGEALQYISMKRPRPRCRLLILNITPVKEYKAITVNT